MSNWNEQQLKHLERTGKIKGYKVHTKIREKYPQKSGYNIPEKRSKEKEWLDLNLQFFCNENCLTLSTEYRFDQTRKWRVDYAIESLKIAIEYEGIFSRKSRHTTITGFTGDVEKYNHAQRLGWTVYRYTAKNYKSVLEDLRNYVKAKL